MKTDKKINPENLPRHIAFIMDGNGRWALKRGLVRTMGHRYGYDRMLAVVRRCAELGIEICTLFAFSTENWKRPQSEIDEIFRVIRENVDRDSELFMTENIRVTAMGDITRFPDDLQKKLNGLMDKTRNNTGCLLNLCINYGGRAEIVRAVNSIINEKKRSISEDEFTGYLYGGGLPDPDIIVRTSGEQRISNFMLWQMAYSELLFIKPFWPDMNAKLVDKCVIEYQKRKRRFGKV